MAGRPCTICGHRDRAEIDRQIVAGASLPAISSNFGVTTKSLTRHRDNHVPTAAMQRGLQAVAAGEALHGAALLGKASSLLRTAEAIMSAALADQDHRTALQAIREAGRMVEICAKLTGDIDPSTTINLTLAPQWVTIQTTILAALAPHPVARQAVVAALEGVR